ncbi:MAG TPA: SRPBCC family protein [Ktedonobacterales bacterium]
MTRPGAALENWSDAMAHAENSVTIARPASEVYAFLLDGENNPRWRPAVLSITREPGSPDGVGAIYRQQLKGPGGRPIAGDYEITAAQPDSLLAFRVIAGPARPTGTYGLSERDGATTLTFILDYPPTSLMGRLMDPVINQTMRGEVATLANLKAYLESRPA